MTTAFTAIPVKMTKSAMFFLDCDMAQFYQTDASRVNDLHQNCRIFVELKDG